MKDQLSENSIDPKVMETSKKLRYASPVLREFGSVAALTKGNSGSGSDGNLKKPPPK